MAREQPRQFGSVAKPRSSHRWFGSIARRAIIAASQRPTFALAGAMRKQEIAHHFDFVLVGGIVSRSPNKSMLRAANQ